MSTEERFVEQVRQHLDRGSAELRPGIAYRLQQARAAALARLAPESAGAQAVVGQGVLAADGRRGPSGRPLYAQPRVWVGIALLVAAMVGYQQWSAWQEFEDLEDLDMKILTSELPIDAYLDRGFQQWLKTGKAEE